MHMSDGAHAIASNAASRPRALDRIWFPLKLPVYLVGPVVVAVDVVLIVAASAFSVVGYHWYFLGRVPDLEPYIAIGLLASLNFTTTLIALGGYRLASLSNLRHQAHHVAWVWTGIFLALLGLAFSLKVGAMLSRGATFGFFGIGLVLLLAWRDVVWRALVQAIANGTFAKQKAILIGERGLLAESHILSDLLRYRYTPAAVFQIGAEELSAIPAAKQLPDTLNSAITVAREHGIKDLLVFVSWERNRCIEVILKAFSVLPARVHLVPDDKVVSYLKRTTRVGEIWTAELKRAPLNRAELGLKRMIDLLGAATGLLLLAPLMAVAALLIKLDSGGPVFFAQWRSGFNGRLFRIFKFRTMTVLEDGPVIQQATREDPRVTRVGRWLRRTNIDELPQLLNVLQGDMSLVGPRPHATAHDSEYTRKIADYVLRHQLKPGITGWAQFNGYRGETRTLDLMSKRIELDAWYIRNWSFWLDLKIIAGTLTKEIWRPHGY